MKETVKVTSVLCGVAALISLITGIRVLTGKGFFLGIALFSMARQGTAMGFTGNLIGMALTAIGFGSMAFFGLTAKGSSAKLKKAFIWGLVMTALCLLNLIFNIGSFNIGYLILLALPAAYTLAVLKSA